MLSIPPLPDYLERLRQTDYPRFSMQEMERLRRVTADLLRDNGCEHLLFCGANRFGSVVQWLTGWPVTAEAVGVFTPGERDTLFVQYVNHAELASIIARDADVAWGGASSIEAAISVLQRRKAGRDHIAFIGPLNLQQHAALTRSF